MTIEHFIHNDDALFVEGTRVWRVEVNRVEGTYKVIYEPRRAHGDVEYGESSILHADESVRDGFWRRVRGCVAKRMVGR